MSDDDTQAIIAYLRSLEAAPSAGVTGDSLNYIGAIMIGAGILPASRPAVQSVQAPPQGITADYGKYVATYGECRAVTARIWRNCESALGPAVPSPRPLVGTLDQAQFVAMMRGGVKPGWRLPWRRCRGATRKMTDDDLVALYSYRPRRSRMMRALWCVAAWRCS